MLNAITHGSPRPYLGEALAQLLPIAHVSQ
jgi:hypothetical protein